MSIRLMSLVFDSETLGPTERLVMLALADHADDSGRCYPSISRLCQRTGLSERAVQTNLRKLVEIGCLTVETGGGRGGTSVYHITLNPAAETPYHMHPRSRNPVSRAENPASAALNPAGDAPEPLRTTNNLDDDDERVAHEHEHTTRERILEAMGVGPDGIAGPSRFLGGPGDMAHAERWLALPGLTLEAILAEIRRVMAAKRDGPPASFKYFNSAMQKLSADMTAPPLAPTRSKAQEDAREAQLRRWRRIAAGD